MGAYLRQNAAAVYGPSPVRHRIYIQHHGSMTPCRLAQGCCFCMLQTLEYVSEVNQWHISMLKIGCLGQPGSSLTSIFLGLVGCVLSISNKNPNLLIFTLIYVRLLWGFDDQSRTILWDWVLIWNFPKWFIKSTGGYTQTHARDRSGPSSAKCVHLCFSSFIFIRAFKSGHTVSRKMWTGENLDKCN